MHVEHQQINSLSRHQHCDSPHRWDLFSGRGRGLLVPASADGESVGLGASGLGLGAGVGRGGRGLGGGRVRGGREGAMEVEKYSHSSPVKRSTGDRSQVIALLLSRYNRHGSRSYAPQPNKR